VYYGNKSYSKNLGFMERSTSSGFTVVGKKNLNVFLFLALGSGACPAWSDVSDLLHCLYACSNFFKWSFHEKPICQVHLSFGQFSMLSNASSMCLSTCGKNNNAGK
jgi:hypothetical protein